MARRSEQGNILGFVLVGAVLVALLVGGVYMIRHHAPSNGDTGKDGETKAVPSKEVTIKDGDPDNSSRKDRDTSLKGALDGQSIKKPSSSTHAHDTQDAHSSAADNNTVAALPATGPSQTITSLVGATLLAGVAAAYVRSRRLS